MNIEKSERTRLKNLLTKYHNKIYFRYIPNDIPLSQGVSVGNDTLLYVTYPKENKKEIFYSLSRVDWKRLLNE